MGLKEIAPVPSEWEEEQGKGQGCLEAPRVVCVSEKTAWQGHKFTYVLVSLCTFLMGKDLVLFFEK